MRVKIPRLMIAATGSGSGKTVLTCALIALLKEKKKKVAAVKCGPDYIDPMFHQKFLGVPSRNLDTFFTGEELTRSLFVRAGRDADIVVMEGVMGLYDGVAGIRKEGSSYHLAEVTKTPVILVVNAHGMGKSILPVIRGFLDYDTDGRIAGVILNRTSRQFFEVIRPEIERELNLPVLGFLPKQKELRIESRHLGLVLPQETEDIKAQIAAVAEVLKETLDFAKLLAIAEGAEELPADEPRKTEEHSADRHKEAEELPADRHKEAEELPADESANAPEKTCGRKPAAAMEHGKSRVKIGVARDEAFCFYYEDNLRLLSEAGAELVYFSPLHEKTLPEGISGLLLGGGYPELYAGELSGNVTMREGIAACIRGGMPVVAECGGFLYLHETMEDMQGREFPMAGVIPGKCYYTGKLVRFGYVTLEEKHADFLPEGETIAGHEFHYYDSTANGTDVIAVKPVSKKRWECVHKRENAWMGFAHLYYYSNPAFAETFVRKAASYADRKTAVTGEKENT